jgi:hypothetical protein
VSCQLARDECLARVMDLHDQVEYLTRQLDEAISNTTSAEVALKLCEEALADEEVLVSGEDEEWSALVAVSTALVLLVLVDTSRLVYLSRRPGQAHFPLDR